MSYIDDYDEAKPAAVSYCSKISVAEFESQSSVETEKALQELLAHLDRNPAVYHDIIKRRKKDEEAEMGMLSYLKARFWSLITGGGEPAAVSQEECDRQLAEMKEEMTRLFAYSQSDKGEIGRRCSKRLAEKRRKAKVASKEENKSSPTPTSIPRKLSKKQYLFRTPQPPPRPPPPPPPPPLRKLDKGTVVRGAFCSKNVDFKSLALRRNPLKRSATHHTAFLDELKDSTTRKQLKKTQLRSPGGTPLKKKKTRTTDEFRYFNQQLIKKFQNVYSPSPSKENDSVFDSPV